MYYNSFATIHYNDFTIYYHLFSRSSPKNSSTHYTTHYINLPLMVISLIVALVIYIRILHLVTTTTVGFGDIYPNTPLAKFLACLLAFGLIVFPASYSTLTNDFFGIMMCGLFRVYIIIGTDISLKNTTIIFIKFSGTSKQSCKKQVHLSLSRVPVN